MAGKTIGVYISELELVERLECQAIRFGYVKDGKPQAGPLCAKVLAASIEDVEAMTDEEVQAIVEQRERGESDNAGEILEESQGGPDGEGQAGAKAEAAQGGPGDVEQPEGEALEPGQGTEAGGVLEPKPDTEPAFEPAPDTERTTEVVLSKSGRTPTAKAAAKPATKDAAKKKGR